MTVKVKIVEMPSVKSFRLDYEYKALGGMILRPGLYRVDPVFTKDGTLLYTNLSRVEETEATEGDISVKDD